jgi:3,4-dihydroxy 2-butanone 4-phosphate synthase/GTP cyclohydrolase II
MSLEYISEHGGAIIYLQQEGRGIGLANKVAAYALQDTGMDTVDANTHLGFPEDCRQYGVVPSMLKDMGIESIKLITNNPRKIERVVAQGIDVVDTIPMVVQKPNAYNRKYLQTKKERMNHRNFGEMLQLDELRSTSDIVNDTVSSLRSDRPIPVAEQYVNAGEEMAALAITSALSEENSEANNEKGVKAKEDGYCFGKKSVELAIEAISRGEIVVVVDDMDRENEGDFIMAADLATPETMATIVRYSSGVICVGMESNRLDELNLPAMLATNEDPKGTAFTVTVDASREHGITTGISSSERAKTIKLLATPSATAKDFNRPGHIFPLRAREGGVLTRDGHTEAAVDLSRLAGRHPSGVLCEIVSEENPTEMARLPELKRFCQKHGFVLTSIVDIAQYRRDTGQ